jgi:hypothetical protein
MKFCPVVPEHCDLHVCTPIELMFLSVEQFILKMTLIHVGALFSVWGSICEIKQ